MDLRPPLEVVAGKLADACGRCGVDYALIGGLAAGAYGSGLRTKDLDACLALSPGDWPRIEALLRELAAEGFRVDLQAIERRAAHGRTILFLWIGLVRLDLMLNKPGSLWEQVLRYRRRVRIEGRELWLASPEEVILTKLAAGREKDLEAARKIAAIHFRALDLRRMRSGAAALAANAPALPERLESLIAEARDLDRLASGPPAGEPAA